MNILGISGFEDRGPSAHRHVYAGRAPTVESILGWNGPHVPLQFFPLQLIGHDASAALLMDGKLAAFVSEERLSRVKHGFNLGGRTVLPRLAMQSCLEQAGIRWSDIDLVAHYCRFTPEGVGRRLRDVGESLDGSRFAMLQNEYETAYRSRVARDVLQAQLAECSTGRIDADRLVQVDHHLAHAAAAFHTSPFDEALILTVDGYGEEDSSLWAMGDAAGIHPQGAIRLPTSLGLLYQVVTTYLGFRSFGDEYKVMGLASYGDPRPFRSTFETFVGLNSDGTYEIANLSRVDLLPLLRESFGEITPAGAYSRKAADIAAALQATLERALLHHLSALKAREGVDRLCMSGGVALNACANGRILRSGLFRQIHITPAAGDDGASLGAALYVQHEVLRGKQREPLRHVYWGPAFDRAEIEGSLRRAANVRWERRDDIEEVAAGLIADGLMIGWFQGRTEMGPRALGARSILADPRAAAIRDALNERVKRREPFRPFAPSVIDRRAPEYFDIPPGADSPFMLATFPTHETKRDTIPAVVHVDGSSRIQTVSQRENPRFYKMIERFCARTGVPIVLNTSFNRAGEPIVNSPQDAIRCFLESGLDALILEDYLVLPDRTDH
jgi:carbamoyltransferase